MQRITDTIPVDGQLRSYLLEMPAPGPLPLVVMLHGTGGTATWAADEAGWADAAERHGFAVVYPEGLPPDPAKPAKFITNPPFWHDGSFGPGDDDAIAADCRFISMLLDQLIAKNVADADRIFVTGFSNGAGMCFAAATAMSERFRAMAPVAGHCWLDLPKPLRPLPTLYIVGDSDPLIPLAGGWVRTPWSRQRLKPSVNETLQKWATAGCPVESIIIPNHGHHWPGGRGMLAERIGGIRSHAMNACERIWQFFERCC